MNKETNPTIHCANCDRRIKMQWSYPPEPEYRGVKLLKCPKCSQLYIPVQVAGTLHAMPIYDS